MFRGKKTDRLGGTNDSLDDCPDGSLETSPVLYCTVTLETVHSSIIVRIYAVSLYWDCLVVFLLLRLNREVGHWVTAVWWGWNGAGRAGQKTITLVCLGFEVPCR